MTKVESFINQVVAIIKGDDANATAMKIWRQADSAFKVQIASLNGDLVSLEDAVANAQEHLTKRLVNYGKEITNRDQYIDNLREAKESLKKTERELAAHKATIAFLEEQYALLKAE